MILGSDVKRITKAICTCVNSHIAWNGINREQVSAAHKQYTESPAFSSNFDGRSMSVHQEFYQQLHQASLFNNPRGISSADRLIYILSCKSANIGTDRCDILDTICPRMVRPVGDPVHIGSLRAVHCGRYIGRGGTGIREAVHGTPVGNITVAFDPQDQENVQIHATFSCRRRNARRVIEGLRTRAGYYQDDTPVPFRERDRFNRNNPFVGLPGFYAGPPGNQEEDMD